MGNIQGANPSLAGNQQNPLAQISSMLQQAGQQNQPQVQPQAELSQMGNEFVQPQTEGAEQEIINSIVKTLKSRRKKG